VSCEIGGRFASALEQEKQYCSPLKLMKKNKKHKHA
jgi:hypothetical protein